MVRPIRIWESSSRLPPELTATYIVLPTVITYKTELWQFGRRAHSIRGPFDQSAEPPFSGKKQAAVCALFNK